jgi:site-specific DNA recombinase
MPALHPAMSVIHAKGNGGTYPYFFCVARMKGTGCSQPYVPVELIEQAVERAYAQGRLPAERVAAIRAKLDQALAGMRERAEAEAARQRHRLAQLTGEREKLLHAYYAGAVPVDLLKQEQDRLATEITQAERHLEIAEQSFGDVPATLEKARRPRRRRCGRRRRGAARSEPGSIGGAGGRARGSGRPRSTTAGS